MENHKPTFTGTFRGGTDMFKRGSTRFDLDYQEVLTIYQKVLNKIRFIEDGLRRVL